MKLLYPFKILNASSLLDRLAPKCN